MWDVLGANAARIRYPAQDYITAIPEYQLRDRTGSDFILFQPECTQ